MKYYRPTQELKGKRLYANTIASFMAAQFVNEPEQIRQDVEMSGRLLHFLLRDSAVKNWSSTENSWLERSISGKDFSLSDKGIKKIVGRLTGLPKAQGVTRDEVFAEFEIIRGVVQLEPVDVFYLAETERSELNVRERFSTDERVLADILSRRGQSNFRAELLEEYGFRCAVTGCNAVDALEAAHITPFSEDQTYLRSNGLLLRADVHTLFDLFLLSIDPISWTIHIAPQLADAYGSFDGAKIALPSTPNGQPDPNRLLRHYNEWKNRWCRNHNKAIDSVSGSSVSGSGLPFRQGLNIT